jgi:hypothetical protein
MNNLIQAITDYTTALEQKLSALEARVAELEEANEAMRREGDEAKALIASLQAEVAALAATGVAIPTSDPEVEIELIVEEDNPIDGESEEQFPSAEESQEELEELDIVQTPVAEEPIAEPIPVVEEPTAETEPEPVVELPIVEPVVEPAPAPAPEPAPEAKVEPVVEVKVEKPAPRPVPQQTSLFGTAVEDIRQAISLGDRFLFQRELFAGNGELMQKTLDEINTLSSLSEAMDYVRDMHRDLAADLQKEENAGDEGLLSIYLQANRLLILSLINKGSLFEAKSLLQDMKAQDFDTEFAEEKLALLEEMMNRQKGEQ